MAHSFKIIPAKPAFGVTNEPVDAGNYILSKKAKNVICGTKKFITTNILFNTQSNLITFKKYNYLNSANANSINNRNLNMNLITKLNLQGVQVIQSNVYPFYSPTSIIPNTTTSIPCLNYIIDPEGNLFGNTLCGLNNYLYYLQYNPPYPTNI